MNLFKKLYKLLFGPDDGWYGKKENRVSSHTISSKPTVLPTVSTPIVPPLPQPIANPNKVTPTGVQNHIYSLAGLTGLVGLTGVSARQFSTGMMGFTGVMGFSGATGLFGGPSISEEEWDNPVKSTENGVTRYLVKGLPHCAFGPANRTPTEERWFIKGRRLTDDQVVETKKILADIKQAPLYLNHDTFKYAAKHVLRNAGE